VKQKSSVNYQLVLQEIYKEVSEMNLAGAPARYIRELANVIPSFFGICLVDKQSKTYGVGDFREPFSIQSISKVFTLTKILAESDVKIWDRVNVEPSGNPFNSMIQLEFERGIPRNPFINAGALVITDALISAFPDTKKTILDFIRELAGDQSINVDQKVYQSELKNSSRNQALANFIKSYDNIENEIDQLIDVYCFHCALMMDTIQLAKSFSCFANDGFSQFANRQILDSRNTKRVNALMLTCGYYDQSGEFAYRVGLPGKSGVGGGAVAVMPGQFTVTAWCPELGEKSNSLKATKALELLTTKLGISLF
jgi:glutaminase